MQNYGLVASLRYLKTRNANKLDTSKLRIIKSLNELNEVLYKVDNQILEQLHATLIEAELATEKMFFENKLNLKRNTIGKASSITRLYCLAYIICFSKPKMIIETGTQHGISSYFIDQTIKSWDFQAKPRLFSFDVGNSAQTQDLTHTSLIVLRKPARTDFKNLTQHLADLNKSKILFFHDSDHSFENMSFEFEWAWNKLRVDSLIADDISNNLAFINIFLRSGVNTYFCQFDNGPVVGLALRKFPEQVSEVSWGS